jgi:hypothetical protein
MTRNESSDVHRKKVSTATLIEPEPAGLILHVAGSSHDGFRISISGRASRPVNASRPSGSLPRSPRSAAPRALSPPSGTCAQPTSSSATEGIPNRPAVTNRGGAA